MSLALGFDTSNYTTSCAWFDGKRGENCSKLLSVASGELGLRQSEALFQHVKRLPELSDRLFAHIDASAVCAIGVSTRPRAVEGSYMPCFLAGESSASVLANALHVPLCAFSHQQGHLAAALWSAGRLDLLDQPFLVWHLSGGTTELLLHRPDLGFLALERIGGTSDISAGQLIDRTGQLLGMDFPAGKALDQAAAEADPTAFFRVRVKDAVFSFSGVQNQVEAFWKRTQSPADTAAFALTTVAFTVEEATKQARRRCGDLPVLFSGGVASNSILRGRMIPCGGIFAAPQFSTDNAMGPAILAWLRQEA